MRHRFRAVVGVVAAAVALGGCASGPAGKVVDAAQETRGPGALTPSPSAPGPSASSAPPASGTPSPSASPSDAEALRVFRTLDIAPLKADGTLDEAETAKRLAEPMLSIVKASFRIAKPDYRVDGRPSDGISDERVLRAAPSPTGDRWFAVSGTSEDWRPGTEEGAGRLFVFHSTAADPTWRLTAVASMLADTAFPDLRVGPDGVAETVTSDAGLVMPLGTVCQAAVDARDKTAAAAWGPSMQKGAASVADHIQEGKDIGLKHVYSAKLRTDVAGPVFRTSDGGALVPCVTENRWTASVMPGYGPMTMKGNSRYLLDTPGTKITGYVDTNISMQFLTIPTTGKPDFVAGLTYPLDYSQTKAR